MCLSPLHRLGPGYFIASLEIDMQILDWLKARLTEKTTWAGLIAVVLGVVGIEATAIQTEQAAGAITTLVGVILALLPEKK